MIYKWSQRSSSLTGERRSYSKSGDHIYLVAMFCATATRSLAIPLQHRNANTPSFIGTTLPIALPKITTLQSNQRIVWMQFGLHWTSDNSMPRSRIPQKLIIGQRRPVYSCLFYTLYRRPQIYCEFITSGQYTKTYYHCRPASSDSTTPSGNYPHSSLKRIVIRRNV